MPTLTADRASGAGPTSHAHAPLLLLFVGSGCAALVYEIVWFQLLQLVIGSSAISLGVLLGTFMGGMCIGSLLLPRYVGRSAHPLRVYAALELGIGVLGLALLGLIPLVGHLYTSFAGDGLVGVLLRGAICGALLLPPTVLMGATLPAIARWVEATPRGVSWLGFFYGGNIVGAVFGALLAGFYLLRVHDLATATFVAAAINGAVAVGGFACSRAWSYAGCEDVVASEAGELEGRRTGGSATVFGSSGLPVYVAIALSGLAALGAEVVWTRVLSLLFGATTYAFSIILAVFLVGLGAGSGAGAMLARSRVNPRLALAWCQLALTAATAWAAWMLAKNLPWWPINASLAPSAWYNFQLDLARSVITVLPGALLWGASFPLALAAVARGGGDAGRLVGRVYAANTVGAIVGSLGFAMLVIPWMGTQGAQRVLVLVSLAAALVLLVPLFRRSAERGQGERWGAPQAPVAAARPAAGTGAAALFGGGVLVSALCLWSIGPLPGGLVAYGRSLPWQGEPTMLYVGEGMNASIAVTELASGYRNFHVSGKIEASTEPQDMRLQRMLGHLSALMHSGPKRVLVVGFGAGVTAGAISVHPEVERLVICEMEPLIPRIVSEYFRDVNFDVARSPRTRFVYDDARHFVLTTREKFDVITSDPIHPWVRGSATLYTREYFEHVKARLNPGGVVTQWVPLYESTEDVVKSEIATFFEVFPDGSIWRNDNTDGSGYDVVLVARLDDGPIDLDALQSRLDRSDYERVRTSLLEVHITNALDLLRSYTGRGRDLAPWLANAEINRDANLRLQYLAGFGFNLYAQTPIRDAMLRYRRFPEDLFAGTEERRAQLRALIEGSEPEE
jgi:spermidine synthase